MVKKKTTKKKSTPKKSVKTASKESARKKIVIPEGGVTTKTTSKAHIKKGAFWGVIVIIALIILSIVVLNYGGEYIATGMAAEGDAVIVKYNGTLDDGSIFDYGDTLNVTIGAGLFLEDFESALVGTYVGERKSFTIPYDRAYGPIDVLKVGKINRNLGIPRLEYANLELLETAITSGTIAVGEEVRIRDVYWPVTITNIDNDNVTLRGDPTIGRIYTPLGIQWGLNATALNDEFIFLRAVDIKVDSRAIVSGAVATISDYDEESIYLDYNHPLAGKDLTFHIEVLGIDKTE